MKAYELYKQMMEEARKETGLPLRPLPFLVKEDAPPYVLQSPSETEIPAVVEKHIQQVRELIAGIEAGEFSTLKPGQRFGNAGQRVLLREVHPGWTGEYDAVRAPDGKEYVYEWYDSPFEFRAIAEIQLRQLGYETWQWL